MITKFHDEIRNLENKKKNVKSEDKELVDAITIALREDLAKIQKARRIGEFFDEKEKMNAQSRLIEVLNELDLQLRDIEYSMKFNPSSEKATESVEQFFITCQVAENVIKFSDKKGYCSKEQIKDLNQEVKKKVDRMIQLSKNSNILANALQQSRRAQTVLAI